MSASGNYRIDSHKLALHPHRVAQWLDGATIYPIYIEISPAGICNHRCTFCAKDYRGYQPRFLPSVILQDRLRELGSLGVGSIMFAGEGEPLLHPDISSLVTHAKAVGIDVAISTNGVFLTPELAGEILPSLSWIKLSIDAGTPAGYAAVHGTRQEDFELVLANLASAAKLVAENGWECTLGTQAILLPENADEIELLAARVKDAGASYLVIKPYSQHHKSHNRAYAELDYSPWLGLQERLERFNDATFSVIFRKAAFRRSLEEDRGYGRCQALPFWTYIDAKGDVWACSSHMGDERFLYGNILEESFQQVWAGERRQRSLDFTANELDPKQCRMNCRMDGINQYLWELAHPGTHVNFI
jgi:radical SAM protein with 4Fe4S-binding SPASM domain